MYEAPVCSSKAAMIAMMEGEAASALESDRMRPPTDWGSFLLAGIAANLQQPSKRCQIQQKHLGIFISQKDARSSQIFKETRMLIY